MSNSQTAALLRAAVKPQGVFSDFFEQIMPILLEFLEMWLSSCTFSAEDAVEKASNPGIVSLIIGQRKLVRALRRNRKFADLRVRQQRGLVVGVFDDISSTAVDQPELVSAAWDSIQQG